MHTESQREEGQKLLLHFSRLPPNHGKESRSDVVCMCTNLFIQQTLGAHCVAGVVVSATGNLAVNDTVSTMMLLALKIPNLSPAPNTPPCDLVAAAPPVCASQGLSQDLEGSDCGSHQSPRWGQDFCWRIQERGREPMSRVLMWEAGGEARGAAEAPCNLPQNTELRANTHSKAREEGEQPVKGLIPTKKKSSSLFFLFIPCSFNTLFRVLRVCEQWAGYGDPTGKGNKRTELSLCTHEGL